MVVFSCLGAKGAVAAPFLRFFGGGAETEF